MCNLYTITTNQAAIIAFFRVINRYVGNLPPMPGVFPDYPAPVIRNNQGEREMVMMRWGMARRSRRLRRRACAPACADQGMMPALVPQRLSPTIRDNRPKSLAHSAALGRCFRLS
jgi:putative SOS response-associated peptidase YedK